MAMTQLNFVDACTERFGNALQRTRESKRTQHGKRVTRNELARRVDCAPETIEKYESSSRLPTNVEDVEKLAKALNCTSQEERDLVVAYICDVNDRFGILEYMERKNTKDEGLEVGQYAQMLADLFNTALEKDQDRYTRALAKVIQFETKTVTQLGGIEEGKTLFEVLVTGMGGGAIPQPKPAPNLFQRISQALFQTQSQNPRYAVIGLASAVATILVIVGLLVISQVVWNVPSAPSVALAVTDVEPAVVVLETQGTVLFLREGWNTEQPVLPGTQLAPADQILAEEMTMRVLCPNGTVQKFSSGDLSTTNTLSCSSSASDNTLVALIGTQTQPIQRGGAENITIPYLIAPRATLVRTARVTLEWNAVFDATTYSLTVRSATQIVHESGELTADDVTNGETAHYALPIDLEPDVSYTVEICVTLQTAEHSCTNGPGVATSINAAFYYHPLPELSTIEQNLSNTLGENSAEALYAQALLLSQPWFMSPTGANPLGYYQEAIARLQTLIADYPDSSLAQSPNTYNLLGELYQRVERPLNAALAFQRAGELSLPGSEDAAIAALGEAATTPDSRQVITLYDAALDQYASFLDDTTFEAQFQSICNQLAGLCLELQHCQDRMDMCLAWAQDDQ
ncbi:MAG: helix-turn-helix domain-containing protein [Anaerolineaceae bacterium]|nr:helix-turn-helix domain-containing protein [Anaerolineaceae bacterium]